MKTFAWVVVAANLLKAISGDANPLTRMLLGAALTWAAIRGTAWVKELHAIWADMTRDRDDHERLD